MLADVYTIQTPNGPQEIRYVIEGYGRKLEMRSDNQWVRHPVFNIPAAPGHFIVKHKGVVSVMCLHWSETQNCYVDFYTGVEIDIPIF